jgi:hypothetical protein
MARTRMAAIAIPAIVPLLMLGLAGLIEGPLGSADESGPMFCEAELCNVDSVVGLVEIVVLEVLMA